MSTEIRSDRKIPLNEAYSTFFLFAKGFSEQILERPQVRDRPSCHLHRSREPDKAWKHQQMSTPPQMANDTCATNLVRCIFKATYNTVQGLAHSQSELTVQSLESTVATVVLYLTSCTLFQQ